MGGLLGNANGNAGEDELATSAGTVLTAPVSFADLYHSYADSWRIAAADSLLCADSKIETGIPAKPFYANDLDRQEYARAHDVCDAAGAKDGPLLNDCTLDVAVLGDETAARVFSRALPPRAVMRPTP